MLNEEKKCHENFRMIVGYLRLKKILFFHSLHNSSHLLLIFKAHILIISNIYSCEQKLSLKSKDFWQTTFFYKVFILKKPIIF